MTTKARTARDEPRAPGDATPKVALIPTPPQRPRRKRRSRLWLWLPVLAALGGAGWYGWTLYNPQEQASAVLTETVARGDIENAVTAVGTLEAIMETALAWRAAHPRGYDAVGDGPAAPGGG